jgi:hypothetical protein
MRKYIEYLDGITVDAEQHGRIMKRLDEKPPPLRQKRTMYQYMGLAACLAIVLLCVWAIPGLFDNPVVVPPDNPGLTVQNLPQNSAVTDEPSEPANTLEPTDLTYPLYPLTLNYVDSLLSAERAYIPGHLLPTVMIMLSYILYGDYYLHLNALYDLQL